ncbi:thioredoxin-like protein [Phyllosticta citricarpa]
MSHFFLHPLWRRISCAGGHRRRTMMPSPAARRATRSARSQAPPPSPPNPSPHQIKPHTNKSLPERGQPYDLSQLKNKVILIVNTASKCGFTPQFEGLEKLYKSITSSHPRGSDFVILGFPCNQFGNQDPGSNDDIQSFCQVNYGVTFPVLGKVDVNGDKAEPLWEWLKKEYPGLMGLKRVKWNFEKFLVGRDGAVKGRWASTTKPESLKEAVEAELAK